MFLKMFAQVLFYTNIRGREMLETALTLKKLINKSTEALFMYSGHGKDWKTLLAPVDSAGGYVVPAREFQDCMAKAKIKVILLDCCRT